MTFFIWNGSSTWWLSYTQRPNGSYSIESYLFPVLINSFLMSIVFLCYSYIKKYVENKKIGYLFLIGLWVTFEKLHLNWELSWPWLNLGNGFSNYPKWIQWYEYTGTLGGTIWIWSVNISLMNGILEYKKNNNKFFLYKNIIINIGKIFFLIFISNYIYIKYEENKKDTVNVLILQPNIDPYHQKYKISTKKLILKLKKLINKKKFFIEKTFIIAPETLFPGYGHKIPIFNINQNKLILIFRNFLKKHPKTVFITGIELYSLSQKKSQTSTPIFLKKIKKYYG